MEDNEGSLRDAQAAQNPVFDARKYASHVEGLDLTEAQKEEFLRTLWWIMVAFVDLGFGVDSVQRVLPGLSELTSEFTANAVDPVQPKPIDELTEAASEGLQKGDHDYRI